MSTLVIVPTLNEKEGIGPTLAEIRDFLHKPLFLVVDGRSTDGTIKIAGANGAETVVQKGHGKGDAIKTAISHARALEVEYVVFIDADYTYPAEYLPRMIQLLDENPTLGMVCGNRFNDHLDLGELHSILYVGNRLLALTHNFLNGINLRDPLTGLRVVRWKILRDWQPISNGFDVEVELNHHVERKGYGIKEIPIRYRSRLGQKKLGIRHGFTILRRIIIEAAC